VDAARNVGIRGGKIVRISSEALSGAAAVRAAEAAREVNGAVVACWLR